MSTNKKRIIVIEDEALIAADIMSTLELLGYQVVGHSMNGDQALDLFSSTPADLILLDISIKGSLNGIDLGRIINDRYRIPFIFLTSFSDVSTQEKVMDLMPYGYIIKPFTDRDLQVNIELALRKFDSEQFSKSSVERKLKVNISQREFDLLKAFNDGLTYKEAGEKMFISVNTVKTHQKRLFKLLGVSSRHELMNRLNKAL